MAAAKAIFAIHLRSSLPYSPNGTMASATRQQIIDTAVATIYSPNSPYAELGRLKFRDGKTRMIGARDFACGRLFQQIAQAAQLGAYQRELGGGSRGLAVCDIEESIASAMERLPATSRFTTSAPVARPADRCGCGFGRADVHRVDRPHLYIADASSASVES